MIDSILDVKVGDKVCYRPYHDRSQHENGIVKEVRDDVDSAVWVVYHCNNDWDNFRDYTGARTNIADLDLGWQE